jgi:carboxypeptidase family protein
VAWGVEMRRTFAAYLLLIAFGVSSAAARAETLQGIVRDPNGALLRQAVLVVERWDSDSIHGARPEPPLMIEPDYKGRYTISLAPGVYDVLVSSPCCLPQVKQIRLLPGKNVQFNPDLKFGRGTKSLE